MLTCLLSQEQVGNERFATPQRAVLSATLALPLIFFTAPALGQSLSTAGMTCHDLRIVASACVLNDLVAAVAEMFRSAAMGCVHKRKARSCSGRPTLSASPDVESPENDQAGAVLFRVCLRRAANVATLLTVASSSRNGWS